MNDTTLSDNELVQETLSDPEAFGRIIDRYTPKLLRYIQRITNVSPEDAEDMLQDAFIKAYQNLKGFDTNLSFSSWIYRITHNVVISGYRKRETRPKIAASDVSEDILDRIASDLETDAEILEKEDRNLILQGLSKLSLKYKEVLILRYFEEYSYDEIADILKKPPGTVATLINRAKKKLKQVITKDI